MMDYVDMLERAWRITWNYRALWIVGLLLVLAGGGVGQGTHFSNGFGGGGDGEMGPGYGPPHGPAELWGRVMPIVAGMAVLIALVVLVALVLGLVALVVRFVARTSLIQMVDNYEMHGEQVGAWEGLRGGWSPVAWRLFLIHVAFKLPLALIALLLVLALLVPIVWVAWSEARGWVAIVALMAILFVPAFLLLMVLRVLIVPFIEVSDRVCVLDGKGAGEAIGDGWRLIKENAGTVALLWLILIALIIGWSVAVIVVNVIILAVTLLVFGVPALALGIAATALLSPPAGWVLAALILIPVLILIFVPLNLALTTLATVYYSTAWTLSYRRLQGEGGEGREDAPVAARSVA